MIKKEGLTSLWKGLSPALMRQICYNSMTMVIYNPIFSFYKDVFNSESYIVKLLSAGISGSISIGLFNWTEVIKTNMQTNTGKSLTMQQSIKKIYNYSGLYGFLYGLKPNIYRSFIVNGVGLGSYEEIKNRLIPLVGDNSSCYLLSSLSSGLLSSIISTPADVIKTRMMDYNREGYTSVSNAIQKIWKFEGVNGFFKGLIPICLRRIVWGSSFFLFYESIYNIGWK